MSRSRHTCALAGCVLPLLVACADEEPAASACEPVQTGERVLLHGTAESLARWRRAVPGSLAPDDECAARTVGGLRLLWFPEECGSCRLSLDWKVTGDDNSGVFVGFPGPGDVPWVAVTEGYEIQIDATDAPDRT